MTPAAATTVNTHRSPGRVADLQSTEFAVSAPVAALSSRDRRIILACLVAVIVLAWGYLVHLDRQMSPAMEHTAMMSDMAMPWTAADLLFTLGMWVVMMVAMMSAPAASVLLLFARAQASRGANVVPLTWSFALGYGLVWTGFSACAVIAHWALHSAALLSPEMAASSPRLGGAILCVAGAYQFTPLKNVCLAHCRSPLGFLLARWRDGKFGALEMGVRHGLYCLGCCWALMAVLFAVGVMNLLWVAALSLLVLIEKVAPAGTTVARIAGALMIVAGLLALFGLR
jgi:predicted metal-binding membrane protein